MKRHLGEPGLMLVFGCLFLLMPELGLSQDDIQYEELQEILKAMQDSDMPAEAIQVQNPTESKGGQRFFQGWWDGRASFAPESNADIVSRLKFTTKRFETRARVRKDSQGEKLLAGTAKFEFGPLQVQAGGVGMNVGYGLLMQRPGRSAGLSAGQSFQSFGNRIVGWGTLPEKRSLWGLAARVKTHQWMVSAMNGQSGSSKINTAVSALHFSRALGALSLGVGLMRAAGQTGGSISGLWEKEETAFGFEWMTVGKNFKDDRHGAWLLSLKTQLVHGVGLQARWAASNSDAGSIMGGRPGVLGSWGGNGWAIRLKKRLAGRWLIQVLWADSNGPHWKGSHQRQRKRLADIMIQGRLSRGWKMRVRWNERTRLTDGWSEEFPWLPPAPLSEDKRVGFAVDLKKQDGLKEWVIFLRSLGRDGAGSVGRRTLTGVRHRRAISNTISCLMSYQWAWGDAVDLVSAVNPVRGLILPRHWGSWAAETLVGVEFQTGFGRLMAAFSRREPVADNAKKMENRFWTAFQLRWK